MIEKYEYQEKSKEVAIFFFIRNFAYSGMFRYNKKGEFNVPYPGIAIIEKIYLKNLTIYNQKSLFHI